MTDSVLNSAKYFLRLMVGVGLSTAGAWLLAHLFAGSAKGAFLPIWFLIVLVALAIRYGLAVGILGSLSAALVFAHFLFSPLGSWHVSDSIARQNLAWMILGGVSLPFLFAPSRQRRTDRPAMPRSHISRSGGQNKTFNSLEK